MLVAGSICNRIKNDEENNITAIGYVDNISDLYQMAKISISFAKVGDGIKTKVVESLSYGVPVFANSFGSAGVVNKNCEALHIFSNISDAETWVEQVVSDFPFFEKISEIAQCECRRSYTRENVKKHIRDLKELGLLC
ncbi:MAG: glycosyltransferase family 4 protein [Alistipes senegalensis]|nr:glycosyltransferase family 4 protein [Oxalobacter formigenes]MCM1281586.1 glycosyltransferase family 4 protein [Alistipes senegalensis]